MTKTLRFKIYECHRCGGGHTEWWKTTPPPSCEERQKRQGKQ